MASFLSFTWFFVSTPQHIFYFFPLEWWLFSDLCESLSSIAAAAVRAEGTRGTFLIGVASMSQVSFRLPRALVSPPGGSSFQRQGGRPTAVTKPKNAYKGCTCMCIWRLTLMWYAVKLFLTCGDSPVELYFVNHASSSRWHEGQRKYQRWNK